MGSTYGNVLDGFDGFPRSQSKPSLFYCSGWRRDSGVFWKATPLRLRGVHVGVLRTPPIAASLPLGDSQPVIVREGMRVSKSAGHDTRGAERRGGVLRINYFGAGTVTGHSLIGFGGLPARYCAPHL